MTEIQKEQKETKEDYIWKKFTAEELELQYSPSRWCKRPVDEVIPHHVKESRERSEVARQTVPTRLNAQYSCEGHGRTFADVYGENLPRAAPLLVYVHGGYWQEMDKDISSHLVTPLYKAGVVVAVLGYDLAPTVEVATIVKEIRTGIAWACRLARGRGSMGVVLTGWSAGGQLVTQALSEDTDQLSSFHDLIRGVVTFSGIFDLRPLVTTYVNQALKLTPESAWAVSPLRGVQGLARAWADGRLRLLLVVGKDDPPEFIRQSKEYCEVCVGAGIPAEMHLAENADHFSLVCDLFHYQNPVTLRLLTFVNNCCGVTKEEEMEAKKR